MKTKHLIFLLGFAFLCFACSNSSSDDLQDAPDPDPDPNPTDKVTYTSDIQAIMAANCTNCHGNPPTNNAPFSLTTYNEVKNRINGILSRTNNASSPMPPSGLMPQATRDLIQQWETDGLLEN